MRIAPLVLVGMSMSLALAPVQASSTTSQFNVTLTITKQCIVTAPGTISLGSFGANDLVATTATASHNHPVNCSKGTPYAIGFPSTNDASNGGDVHQMRGTGQNGDVVQYSLLECPCPAGRQQSRRVRHRHRHRREPNQVAQSPGGQLHDRRHAGRLYRHGHHDDYLSRA